MCVCACVVYMCEEGRYSSKSKEVIAGCEEVCVLACVFPPPVGGHGVWVGRYDNHATTMRQHRHA